MNNLLLNKILKYSAEGAIIYLGFRYLIATNIKQDNLLICTLMIVLCTIVLENIVLVYKKRMNDKQHKNTNVVESLTCGSNTCVNPIEPFENNDKDNDDEDDDDEDDEDDDDNEDDDDEDSANIYNSQNIEGDQEIEEDQEIKENQEMVEMEEEEKKAIQKHILNTIKQQKVKNINKKQKQLKKPTKKTKAVIKKKPTKPIKQLTKKQLRKPIEYPPYENDMEYVDANTLPVPKNYRSKDYEYGHSFLPPENWYPQPPHPPVCVTDKRCPVCPVYTEGVPIDVKEWDSSRTVTAPVDINLSYYKDKMKKSKKSKKNKTIK